MARLWCQRDDGLLKQRLDMQNAIGFRDVEVQVRYPITGHLGTFDFEIASTRTHLMDKADKRLGTVIHTYYIIMVPRVASDTVFGQATGVYHVDLNSTIKTQTRYSSGEHEAHTRPFDHFEGTCAVRLQHYVLGIQQKK
jgi:hypothetical protein